VSVRRTDLDSKTVPTRYPSDPGGIPSVPSSQLGKRTPHPAPDWRPDAATSAMPPGSRRPSVAASRPSCCALHSLRQRRVRRVSMSPLSRPRARPPPLCSPACRPPERKAGTQELLAVLAGCGGSQIFTACLLSCGRKSPSSFGPTGSRPCCPSADPQARPPLSPCRRLTEPPAPLHPPLPAAFCGRVPRLRRDPRPQNAVPY